MQPDAITHATISAALSRLASADENGRVAVRLVGVGRTPQGVDGALEEARVRSGGEQLAAFRGPSVVVSALAACWKHSSDALDDPDEARSERAPSDPTARVVHGVGLGSPRPPVSIVVALAAECSGALHHSGRSQVSQSSAAPEIAALSTPGTTGGAPMALGPDSEVSVATASIG